MSLIHKEWQPRSSRRFAKSTQVCVLCTGLVV
ncbi:Uncharacterised protein [Vibrio cholerae]|nr:Uncharacterised protein [Vibrio cholerae]